MMRSVIWNITLDIHKDRSLTRDKSKKTEITNVKSVFSFGSVSAEEPCDLHKALRSRLRTQPLSVFSVMRPPDVTLKSLNWPVKNVKSASPQNNV